MTHIFRAVLVLFISANCVGLATLLTNHAVLQETYAGFQEWMVPVLALLALASIGASLALWLWHGWGFVVLLVAYALMLVINLSFEAPLAHTALGPIGLVLLAAAWWPVRDHFHT